MQVQRSYLDSKTEVHKSLVEYKYNASAWKPSL